MLPPQNATGNWVKVVQRIPVRIAVTCREGDPPLRVGMSATIEIDTGHSRSFGSLLSWARQELRPVERVGLGQAMTAGSIAAVQAPASAWLTVVVMMATIMQALDGTIANVALPTIQGSLSATQEQVAWVITSYIVSSAITTPLAGFCAVRFGVRRTWLDLRDRLHHRLDAVRRRPDAAQLVLFRALQGVFGAALVPAQPGADDGHLSARGAGQGDGDVGRRHHDRPDRRPVARRLADRRISPGAGCSTSTCRSASCARSAS